MSLLTPLFAACSEEESTQGCPGEGIPRGKRGRGLYPRPHARQLAGTWQSCSHSACRPATRTQLLPGGHIAPQSPDLRCGGGIKPPPQAPRASSSPGLTVANSGWENYPPPAPTLTLPAETRGGSSAAYLREGLVQREPAAERHDAGQLVLAGESRVQRQGTALPPARKVR